MRGETCACLRSPVGLPQVNILAQTKHFWCFCFGMLGWGPHRVEEPFTLKLASGCTTTITCSLLSGVAAGQPYRQCINGMGLGLQLAADEMATVLTLQADALHAAATGGGGGGGIPGLQVLQLPAAAHQMDKSGLHQLRSVI